MSRFPRDPPQSSLVQRNDDLYLERAQSGGRALCVPFAMALLLAFGAACDADRSARLPSGDGSSEDPPASADPPQVTKTGAWLDRLPALRCPVAWIDGVPIGWEDVAALRQQSAPAPDWPRAARATVFSARLWVASGRPLTQGGAIAWLAHATDLTVVQARREREDGTLLDVNALAAPVPWQPGACWERAATSRGG